MRLRNEPSVPPIGISDLFKPEQLASFLLGAVVVVFTGLVASRTGIIRTRSGNVKGLDIFAYKICMPIMLINIAATHNFTSYDWKFIAACMLAKLITFACVWAITYFFYKTDRPQRSRLTTAATTSTATVTSADLSFGIPLMRLICKSYEFNIDSDMLACTICSVLIFGPLSTALLHCSTATEEDNDDPRCQTFGRAILNHITLHEANLQVLSVLFGFAIRGYLSYASIDMDQRNQASTVSAIVNMFVVTFPVVALFVTGTMVDVAKNNQWTFFFATWKVFGAAFLSFSLRKAFGLGGDDNWSRASATFFYGSLPVSSAILTGLHVDRTSKELVAGIILWSYVISLPITLSGISLFGILEKSSHIIQYGMYSLDVLSCVLGLGICLVIILMGSQYGFGCRAKLLLFLYFLFTLASCFLYCITSVINDPSYCNVYFMYPHDRLVSPHFILLDMFSDTCTVMLVAFHVLLLRDSDDSVNEPCQAGLIAIVCFLVGGTKAWITFPACPAGTRMCGMALVSHTISPFARNTGGSRTHEGA
eukprot:TRINITY_DN6338_c1_g1_i2.p1 TRINITY_DN6338_c1_g1~~TRINITY_DN6338_c1_g1_i2.p1  ORF type:complete len:536 (+),score=2.41 TRINITY_DN6338_c1_g1_i2:40-1647(+)